MAGPRFRAADAGRVRVLLSPSATTRLSRGNGGQRQRLQIRSKPLPTGRVIETRFSWASFGASLQFDCRVLDPNCVRIFSVHRAVNCRCLPVATLTRSNLERREIKPHKNCDQKYFCGLPKTGSLGFSNLCLSRDCCRDSFALHLNRHSLRIRFCSKPL